MIGVPVSPRRVFGVDFSGARDAGKHIWVCRAHPGDEGVRVESVDPVAKLPGGARQRDRALAALTQKISEAPRSAWGFDFPFGLPREIVAELSGRTPGSWLDQLEVVAALDGADEFRRRCQAAGAGREQRRATDEEASTPFSPYNLRLYRQTYHGMTQVLRPLYGRPEIAVLPMDELPDLGDAGQLAPNVRAPRAQLPHIYLLEICPSSLLDVLEYGPRLASYKGRDRQHAERRQKILRRLVDDRHVRPMARTLRSRIIDDPGGDALDAVLAAVGTWRGYRGYDHGELRADPRYALEGHVYT